jgi:hypothetical protein
MKVVFSTQMSSLCFKKFPKNLEKEIQDFKLNVYYLKMGVFGTLDEDLITS